MTRELVLKIASNEDGYRESSVNSNMTKYGEWYGLNGVSWCAIFVSWVFNEAGCPLGKIDSLKGFQDCTSAYYYWKRQNSFILDPMGGDIILYDFGRNDQRKSDHTGIFVKWIEKGRIFQAWEGNTSPRNARNGGQVMLQTRNLVVVREFVDPGVY